MKKGLLEQIGRKQEGNAICRLLLEYASRKISISAPAEGNTCDFSAVSTLPCAKLPAIFWMWIVSRRKCSLGWESGRLCAHNRGSQGTRQDGAGWRIGKLELGQRKSEHEFDLQRMCFVTEDALLLCHIAFEISSVPVRLLTKPQIHAMVYQTFERSMAMAGGNNTVTWYWDSLCLHCRTQTPAQCIDGS